jgi:hypothetical protein
MDWDIAFSVEAEEYWKRSSLWDGFKYKLINKNNAWKETVDAFGCDSVEIITI